MPQTITVELGERSYNITVGAGLLERAGEILPIPLNCTKVAVISDENVAGLYAQPVAEAFENEGREVLLTTIRPGEEQKNPETLAYLWRALLEAGLCRRDLVVALGGGVVGDVAGFAAGTYMRSVPYVQIPTTLLAQVDSSVGGKTAIDLPAGKNMAGLFYQPAGVLIDVSTLKSLPEREFRAGLAEVVKTALIWDAEFFLFLEENLDRILKLEPDVLVPSIVRCCDIKAQVVSSDETEAGLRRILNLGHTAGHALEGGSGYGTYLHGEAVAWGLKVAARLAAELGMLPHSEVDRVEQILARLRSVPERPSIAARTLMDFMRRDKKAGGGRLTWVLPRAVGRVVVRDDVDDELILDVLKQYVTEDAEK